MTHGSAHLELALEELLQVRIVDRLVVSSQRNRSNTTTTASSSATQRHGAQDFRVGQVGREAAAALLHSFAAAGEFGRRRRRRMKVLFGAGARQVDWTRLIRYTYDVVLWTAAVAAHVGAPRIRHDILYPSALIHNQLEQNKNKNNNKTFYMCL